MSESVSSHEADRAAQPNELAKVLLAEQERARAEARDLIESAIRMSEEEIGAASAEIRGINEQARSQVALLQRLSQRQRERAGQLIAKQGELGDRAADGLAAQRTAVTQSVGLAGEITELASSIREISMAIKIIGLNGSVEAARLGGAGRPFAVIVSQLGDLSGRVEVANRTITRLATDLTKTLPNVATISGEVQELVEQIRSLNLDGVQFQQQLERVLARSEQDAEQIFLSTSAMITHMQFQDRLSQELRKVDPINEQLTTTLQRMFEFFAQNGGADPSRVIDEVRADRRVTQLGQACQSDGADALSSGEVELF